MTERVCVIIVKWCTAFRNMGVIALRIPVSLLCLHKRPIRIVSKIFLSQRPQLVEQLSLRRGNSPRVGDVHTCQLGEFSLPAGELPINHVVILDLVLLEDAVSILLCQRVPRSGARPGAGAGIVPVAHTVIAIRVRGDSICRRDRRWICRSVCAGAMATAIFTSGRCTRSRAIILRGAGFVLLLDVVIKLVSEAPDPSAELHPRASYVRIKTIAKPISVRSTPGVLIHHERRQ
ncbi:hypothetical protein CJ197_06230 [Brachybacterium sp. UMB0905]|nr:hypothetical protein CJ197_06230 [Brachybacterium sp. UMB0905]